MATECSPPRFRCSLVLLLPLLFAACVRVPDGVTPVERLDLDRYLGTWYEIARLDHPFERGLSDVTADYAPRQDGGLVVVNRGYDAERGEWREARGKAYPVAEDQPGRLRVSFFGPFYAGYNVIALDEEDYAWSMVAGPDRSYLWILARSPDLDQATVDRLIAWAEALDFPVADLIFVEHGRRQPTDGPG